MPDQPVPPLEARDPRRARLLDQLLSLGPGPVALYRDACRFFDGLILAETASHLAGHLQRELLSAVHDVLLPPDYSDPKAGDDPKSIEAVLGTLALPQNTDTTRLRKALRQYFKPQGGGGIAKVKIIANALGLPVEHEVVALSRELKQLHSIAHRSGLDAPPALDSLRETWERFQRLLSLLLEHFEKSYASAYGKIRAAIAAHDLPTFRTMVPQNFTTLNYFFERIEGDRWFQIIRSCDMITAPPAGGGWPALGYLLRMAQIHPAEVRDLLLAVPSTENEFVLMGMIDAARQLPPEDALAVLVRIGADVVALRADAFVQRDFTQAVGECSGVNPDLALSLLRPILELHVTDASSGGYLGSRELTACVDVHSYSDIIDGPLQAVIAASPESAVSVLIDLLNQALTEVYGSSGEDCSIAWRAAIEPHEQNHEFEPLPHLLDAVRLATERLCTVASVGAADVIRSIAARPWTIFKRLALHLARVTLPPTHPLVREYVLDPQTLRSDDGRHEKHLLVAHAFPHLSADDQRRFIDAILAGAPEVHPDDELRDARVKRWKVKRLAWVAVYLPERARRTFDELRGDAEEKGPEADFDLYTTAMWGPTSPKNTADFEAMPLSQLVEFLRTWAPPPGMMVDTREGVARELAPAVERRAEEISDAAEQFVGLDPTFVRSVISGFSDAARNSKPIMWRPVLQLAAWAVAQPREIAGRSRSDMDDDPDWGWTRAQIGRLLQQGFMERKTKISSEHRSLVWSVLSPLTDDPDPDESRNEGNDPLNTAINSTRGVAFEALIAYAAWVRGGTFGPPSFAGLPFHDMPEVEAVLSRHLDADTDSSPAVRAVYGQNLFYIFLLEKQWVVDHLDRLFPEASPGLADAVWQTYLVYGRRFSKGIIRALRPQYERAVDALGSAEPLYRDYASQLGSHLLYQYLDGDEVLGPGSLLDRFFDNADVNTRTRIVSFVPRSVDEFAEQGENPPIERAEAFWSWRVATSDDGADLRGFGLWVPNSRFDPVWRLTQLKLAIDRAGVPLHEPAVIDALTPLAGSHASLVLGCVSSLIHKAGTYTQICRFTYRGEIEAILRDTLASADKSVCTTARELVNTLIAKGFTKLLTLLEPPLPEDKDKN